MNINQNITESDNIDIDVISQLENQIQIQETKKGGWILDKNSTIKIRFYKTGGKNGLSFFETPLRSNVISNIENNDNYCFLWSILGSLHPCKSDHPNKVSNYREYFDEINI